MPPQVSAACNEAGASVNSGRGPGLFDLLIHAPRAITPAGEVAISVGVRDGVITAIEPVGMLPDFDARRTVRLATDEVLLPGLVDTHVHVNDPGRTEWEGFASATRAAAAGGVTTIVDMPLNSLPPTVDVRALEIKRAAAGRQIHVDVGFWGGVIPGNRDELRGLHAAGVFGFKAFLADSGGPEFPPVTSVELGEAMAAVDALYVIHAEDPAHINEAPHSARYPEFLASRPARAEQAAIATAVAQARKTDRRVHILHLSAADALPLIARAKVDGVRVTAETCPHYLTLDAD